MVVLANGEALPLARRASVDVAVNLQEHGPLLEREPGVGVRLVDHERPAVRREVEELATVPARRDVNDDIELFIGGLEGALDAGVEARRDDELLWQLPLAQQRRQRCKPGVEQRRLDVPVQREVQLVVERPDPISGRDRLRDVGEPPVLRLSSKRSASRLARSSPATLAAPGPRTGTRRPAAKCAHHLVVVILDRWLGDTDERPLLAKDRAVQRLQLRAGLDPELVDERSACVAVRRERVGLPARAVQREHQLRTEPFAQRMAADEQLQLRHELGLAPRARAPRRSAPRARRAEAPRADESRPERSPRAPSRPAQGHARARGPRAAAAHAPRARRRELRARVFEAGEVELAPVELEHVPGRPRLEETGAEELAQLRDRFCSDVVAVRGGCSPQSWSTRRSVETGSFARRSNSVRSARWFRPPSGTVVSPSSTSSGPRIRNSSTATVVTGFTSFESPAQAALAAH